MNSKLSLGLVCSIFLLLSCGSDPEPNVDCATLNLSLEIETTQPTSCLSFDGSIQITAMGFSEPLEYSLNNGAPNNTGVFTNLSSGTYLVAVEGSKGCDLVQSIELKLPDVDIEISSISSTKSGCSESTAALEISATSESPLTYSLDGLSFQEDNVFQNISAGLYNVVVRDDECQISESHRVLSDVSFSSDIEAIINANCAVTGCHVAGTGRVDFTLFSNVQGTSGEMKSRTQSKNMPPDGRTITQDQIDLLACWVDDGALEN